MQQQSPCIKDISTQLFISCINNDIPTMKSLIEQKADPNCYRNLFLEESNQYIRNNDKNNNNNNINSSTTPSNSTNLTTTISDSDNHNTLLHAAILSNSIETIQYVINDLGINNFCHLDYCGHDALSIAIISNNYEATQYLIQECKLIPNVMYFIQNVTPHFPNRNILELLLTTSNIQQKDFINHNYLKLLIQNGLLLQFQYFIEKYQFQLQSITPSPGDDENLLIVALTSNQCDFVHYLITSGYQLSQQHNGEPMLFTLIKHNAFQVIKQLISTYKFDQHVVDKYGNGLLYHLIINQSTPIEFIDHCIDDFSIDPNQSNKAGLSPIYAYLSYIESSRHIININLVQHLIQSYNINLTKPHNYKSHLLHICFQSGNITPDFIKLLQQHGQFDEVIINSQYHYYPYHLQTPIQIASRTCSFEVIQLLIEYNATIPMNNDNNNQEFISTLLQQATINQDAKVLHYFLQHPNINVNGEISQDLLNELFFKTIESQSISTAKLLIEQYNINPMNIQHPQTNYNMIEQILDHFENTLHLNHELITYLVQQVGFTIKCPKSANLRLLSIALEAACPLNDIISLITIGGDDYKDVIVETNQTILHVALSTPHVPISVIDYLIHIGCDINVLDNEGNSILHSLIMNEQCDYKLVRYLLFKYPSLRSLITIQNNNGDTILHQYIAKWDCNSKTIKCLLSFISNVDEMKNKSGLTPYQYAIEQQQYSIAKVLLNSTNCHFDVTSIKEKGSLHLICHVNSPVIIKYQLEKADFMNYLKQFRNLQHVESNNNVIPK